MSKVKKDLRSKEWFGNNDKMGFVHRSWLRNQGYPDDYFNGKPVIGICNTWSELTPCNGQILLVLNTYLNAWSKAIWASFFFKKKLE